VPTDFGLSYEDLPLRTPDGITLRSYILRQRKELGHHQAGDVETSESQTDEEVSGEICLQFRLLITCAVRGDATHCANVSRERWKPWTSHTSCQGILYQNEMQCAYAFISRVSTQVFPAICSSHAASDMAFQKGLHPKKVDICYEKCTDVYSLVLSRTKARCTDRPRLRYW
jgi:hypothetical protein